MARLLDRFAPPGRWDAAGLRALGALLVVHAGVRSWGWRLPEHDWLPGPLLAAVIIVIMRLTLIAAAIATLRPQWTRSALRAATFTVCAQVALSLPEVADHLYLELFCLVLMALIDPESEHDGPLLRSSLCWMAVIVLFYSGVQKALHGYYFFAQLPLLAVAQQEAFGELFAWLLPPSEVARLRGFNLALPEAGPFRAASAAVLILANAVWTLPTVLAALTLAPSTRRFAALAAVVAVLVVHLAARQPLYALLMTQLLILLIPGQWNRRLAPLLLIAYAVLALVIARILPPELIGHGWRP